MARASMAIPTHCSNYVGLPNTVQIKMHPLKPHPTSGQTLHKKLICWASSSSSSPSPSSTLPSTSSSSPPSPSPSSSSASTTSTSPSPPVDLIKEEEQIRSRRLWLPGSNPPPHLDGSLPGDFGFDPLDLGKDPESLKWYIQAELIHARFAMAGVAGILFTDVLRTTGLKDLPVWYEAGASKIEWADTQSLFFVQLILMGFVETKRYMDFKAPHSQGAEDSFFGLEPVLQGLEPGYPGGPLFNPFGFGMGIGAGDFQTLKEKEIKNGRLAMVAMVGFIAQASLTDVGPVDNLLTHLADPWHNTVVQTLSAQQH